MLVFPFLILSTFSSICIWCTDILSCSSKDCQDASRRISSWIDRSVDECDNFYKFSCGGWQSAKEIAPGEDEISVFSETNKMVDSQIEAILANESIETKAHLESVRKAQRFFKSCMNLTALELAGPEPILRFINTLNIPWPISREDGNDDGKYSKWDVYASIIFLHRNHFPANPFFMVDVSGDNINSGKRIIKLDDSGISLQNEVYWNEPKMLKFYEEYVTAVHQLLLGDEIIAKEMASHIVDIEKRLSKVMQSIPSKSGTHMRTNLLELQHIIPEFPWMRYFTEVFYPMNISRTEPLLISSPTSLYQISRIITEFPKRNISSYLVWHAIREKLSLLDSRFRTNFNRFRFQIQHQHNQTSEEINNSFNKTYIEEKWYPRNEFCRTLVNNHFGLALMGPYVESVINDEVITESEKLLKYLMDAIRNTNFHHSWIDSVTRTNLIKKLEGLISKIGYPSYAFNQSYIMDRYKFLENTENDLFFNALNSDQVYRNKTLQKLRNPVDKSRWSMLPQTINAMYQYFQNEIVVPAGILQAPFFYVHSDLPKSLSFGSLGSILGHELTHAFDSTGRKFDKDGKVVKEWWTGASIQSFNFLSLCFQEQYSSYKVSDTVKIDGRLTLVENIADNGGIQASYAAYKTYVQNHGHDRILSGLNFTSDQLFFISHAQEYCSKTRTKSEELSSQVESHSPASARVIGVLSNMKEFSEAFGCKLKSKMNPERKCRIW